jgi:hypothetical protein
MSRPGTRPYAWWEYDAPRESIGTCPGIHLDGKLSAPRKHLYGTGTPVHEKLSFGPRYKFGIPTDRVFPVLVKWYPDKDSKLIDPDDPPVFENQARYLDRYQLLTDDEQEFLPADVFDPVVYFPD